MLSDAALRIRLVTSSLSRSSGTYLIASKIFFNALSVISSLCGYCMGTAAYFNLLLSLGFRKAGIALPLKQFYYNS